MESTELAIILGVGVDWTQEGRVRMTVQIANPPFFAANEAGGEKSKSTSWVISEEGETVAEAEERLTKVLSRHVFWDDCVILVLGEEMAKKGALMVSNYFQRNRGPRESMLVLVTTGEAKAFLETYSTLEKTSAQATALTTKMKTGYDVELWELAEMLAGKEIQLALTWVEAKEVGTTPGAEQAMNTPTHKQLEISGTGVFKDDKLIGRLDNYETTGMLWLKGESATGTITVPDPVEPDKKVSLLYRRSKRTIIPEYDGKNLKYTVKIKVEGDLVEQQSRENLAKPEMISRLEKEMADEIKKRILVTLQKSRDEYGVDIFGFGGAFHRKYKNAWREVENRWDTVFTTAEFDIEVEAYIRESGFLGKRGSA